MERARISIEVQRRVRAAARNRCLSKSVAPVTPKLITRSFQRLRSHPCWGIRFAHHLNMYLTLHFGKPSLEIREPVISKSKFPRVRRLFAQRGVTVKGQWILWLYCCHWKISSKGRRFTTCWSTQARIEEAILELEGQKIIDVEVKARTGATSFAFDLGGVLECHRSGKDGPVWHLFKPNGYVLTVYADGTFSHQAASAPNSCERRMRIDS
jgi:hypothetical protein